MPTRNPDPQKVEHPRGCSKSLRFCHRPASARLSSLALTSCGKADLMERWPVGLPAPGRRGIRELSRRLPMLSFFRRFTSVALQDIDSFPIQCETHLTIVKSFFTFHLAVFIHIVSASITERDEGSFFLSVEEAATTLRGLAEGCKHESIAPFQPASHSRRRLTWTPRGMRRIVPPCPTPRSSNAFPIPRPRGCT